MTISRKTAEAWKIAMDRGLEKIVLLCDSRLRASLASMLARTVPPLPVVAYDEIILGADVEPVKTISDESGYSKQDEKQMIAAAV
jgi:flagellar biosynthesis component FlhA